MFFARQGALQIRKLFAIGTATREPLFPGSSVVEQPAVNRLVAGSNPARGATFLLPCTLTFDLLIRGIGDVASSREAIGRYNP